MRICFILPFYEPVQANGVVAAASALCRGLIRKGVEVSVLTLNVDHDGGRLPVPVGRPVNLGGVTVRYFAPSGLSRTPFVSYPLLEALKQQISRFDAVHVNAIWQYLGVQAATVANHHVIPLVISPHGSLTTWSWEHRRWRKWLYWHAVGHRQLKLADVVHFTSRLEQRKSVYYPKKDSVVVPNGIDLSQYARKHEEGADLRKKYRVPPAGVVLLHMGRIHRKKGIHYVIRAMGELIRSRPIHFFVAGPEEDVGYVAYLRRLIREFGLQARVHWIGQVAGESWQAVVSASDLFVLLSHDENFGMAVVEAMAMELPVLISENVGVSSDVRKEGGGWVLPLDDGAIIAQLSILANSSSILRDAGLQGRRTAQQHFDINTVAVRMMGVYEHVISAKQGGIATSAK